MAQEKQFPYLLVLMPLIAIAVLLLGGFLVYQSTQNASEPPQTACTMEAMQCPDGSYVGRTGPNCEFAACPAAKNPADQSINSNANYGVSQ